MSRKTSIYNFNHIDQTKAKDQIDEIKELYKYYHFRFWCYQKAYKYFKRLNLVMNISSVVFSSRNVNSRWCYHFKPNRFRRCEYKWFTRQNIQ